MNTPTRAAAPRSPAGRAIAAAMAAVLALGLGACAAPRAATDGAVVHLTAEDTQVRIDELRVRGQTQKLTVQPKHGGRAYDIVPPSGGQDLSQPRSTVGQRVWPLLQF